MGNTYFDLVRLKSELSMLDFQLKSLNCIKYCERSTKKYFDLIQLICTIPSLPLEFRLNVHFIVTM